MKCEWAKESWLYKDVPARQVYIDKLDSRFI